MCDTCSPLPTFSSETLLYIRYYRDDLLIVSQFLWPTYSNVALPFMEALSSLYTDFPLIFQNSFIYPGENLREGIIDVKD